MPAQKKGTKAAKKVVKPAAAKRAPNAAAAKVSKKSATKKTSPKKETKKEESVEEIDPVLVQEALEEDSDELGYLMLDLPDAYLDIIEEVAEPYRDEPNLHEVAHAAAEEAVLRLIELAEEEADLDAEAVVEFSGEAEEAPKAEKKAKKAPAKKTAAKKPAAKKTALKKK